MSNEGKRPIIYEAEIDIRFGDLDSYGHVNSMNYLDFVSSSRLIYLARKMNMTGEELVQRGLGFYLVKSTIEYLRPILCKISPNGSHPISLMGAT